MVVIAPGSFRMGDLRGEGSGDERPVRTVTISKPFAIGRYEVTVAQFRRFVQATGYWTDAERGDGCYVWDAAAGRWRQQPGRSWHAPGFRQFDVHPTVCLSHRDAQAYITWLSECTGAPYRLPTEAEWEYATRAGTSTVHFWGDAHEQACAYANVHDRTSREESAFGWEAHDCDDGFGQTAPAGSFQPNGFGLYDTLGNAWEWVEDCWHGAYESAPVDGSAWLEGAGGDCRRRVIRGGYSLREEYVARYGDEESGRLQFGLTASYRLLSALGARVGQR